MADAIPSIRLLTSYGIRQPEVWSALLTPACKRTEIVTTNRLALFLANTIVETGGFRYLTESLNYSVGALLSVFGPRRGMDEATAHRLGRKVGERALDQGRQWEIANLVYGGDWGRRNLGNVSSDDGWRYRGRGLIQMTGKANYKRFAKVIGRALDESFLDWLATPAGAVESATFYWYMSGCNVLADQGAVEACRKRVNGGLTAIDEIHGHYTRLKRLIALDLETAPDKTLLRLPG